jgi:hypothetical protein
MRNKSGINCQKKHCDRTHDFHQPRIEVRGQRTEDRSLVSVDDVQVAAIADHKYQTKKLKNDRAKPPARRVVAPTPRRAISINLQFSIVISGLSESGSRKVLRNGNKS